jgi:hypothetical protein
MVKVSRGGDSVSFEKFTADDMRGGWDFGGQERRDQAAHVILAHARSGADDLSACLYLRPFESVNRMPAQVASPSPESTASYVDFEQILRKAVETLDRASLYTSPLHLVALGEYDAAIFGAGLAQASEAEWRECFAALTRAVRLIVMVPSVRPGTLWELSQLVGMKAWGKTLFVMPESLYSREAQVEAERLWQQVTVAARDLGVALPAYDKNGAIFRLSADGSVLGTRPLRLTRRWRRVPYLRRAIVDLQDL